MISGVPMVTLAVDGGVPEFTAAAIFFGVGAALVLDEFALILHLEDVYWAEDGRTSVDAVFAAVAVAGLLILGFNPLSFFDIGIWRNDTSVLARVSVVGLAGADPASGGGRAAEGQGVDRAHGHVHHPSVVRRCHPALPAACPMGPVALPGQAQEDAPRAGTGALHCAGRWCRPSCGFSTSSPASPASRRIPRWMPNSTARSTPRLRPSSPASHQPNRRSRRRPRDRFGQCGTSTTPSSSTMGAPST